MQIIHRICAYEQKLKKKAFRHESTPRRHRSEKMISERQIKVAAPTWAGEKELERNGTGNAFFVCVSVLVGEGGGLRGNSVPEDRPPPCLGATDWQEKQRSIDLIHIWSTYVESYLVLCMTEGCVLFDENYFIMLWELDRACYKHYSCCGLYEYLCMIIIACIVRNRIYRHPFPCYPVMTNRSFEFLLSRTITLPGHCLRKGDAWDAITCL